MSTTAIDEQDERVMNALRSDALDTDQILEELRGNVIEEYFYKFTAKGASKPTIGMSFAGVKYVASLMADNEHPHPISVEHVEIRESIEGNSWVATAMAKDLSNGVKRWGDYEQRKFDDKGVPIPFSYTLASSKAQRNAIKHHIPETMIQEGYRKWSEMKEGKGRANGAKPVDAKVRKINDGVDMPSLQYLLRDAEGAVVSEAKGELRITVPAGKLTDNTYMENLKAQLADFEPLWIGKEKGGPYFQVLVK